VLGAQSPRAFRREGQLAPECTGHTDRADRVRIWFAASASSSARRRGPSGQDDAVVMVGVAEELRKDLIGRRPPRDPSGRKIVMLEARADGHDPNGTSRDSFAALLDGAVTSLRWT
jgi:hypothetical protein